MSKKSAKTMIPPDYVTRKQQVRAIRDIKTQEVAKAVAERIEGAVRSEVESQLKSIKDTMLSLIDRVVDLEMHTEITCAPFAEGLSIPTTEPIATSQDNEDEDDASDRQEGAETPQVSEDPDVARDPFLQGILDRDKDDPLDDAGGGLLPQGTGI